MQFAVHFYQNVIKAQVFIDILGPRDGLAVKNVLVPVKKQKKITLNKISWNALIWKYEVAGIQIHFFR